MEDPALRRLVERSREGDRKAVEELVRAIQDDVFNLAVRMLGDADDARDATQEALVRIVAGLGTYRGESRFRTWVYRVAANSLLDARGARRRRENSFDETAALLDAGLVRTAPGDADDPSRAALAGEVKLFCTHGMLLCLDRPHRLAYILGEILELPGEDAAAVLEIAPEAFRKRLSRARRAMEAFLQARCGLANPSVPCRCARLVPMAAEQGLFQPGRRALRSLPARAADRLKLDLERARSAAQVYRSLPRYGAPPDLAAALRGLLAGAGGEDG